MVVGLVGKLGQVFNFLCVYLQFLSFCFTISLIYFMPSPLIGTIVSRLLVTPIKIVIFLQYTDNSHGILLRFILRNRHTGLRKELTRKDLHNDLSFYKESNHQILIFIANLLACSNNSSCLVHW